MTRNQNDKHTSKTKTCVNQIFLDFQAKNRFVFTSIRAKSVTLKLVNKYAILQLR